MVRLDEAAHLRQLAVVDGVDVHGGPDGDHELCAHVVELLDHGIGVRPAGGIELPVALAGPVEEVDDDHVQRDAAALVLARDGEDLVLGAVAQLALPEAHDVLAHHRRAAGDGGVVLLNLLRGVAGGDPVVHLAGGVGDPLGAVEAERHAAQRRVVPQKAVAAGGEQEGDRGLGVALRQLQRQALAVELLFLVLAKAVEPFAVVGLKEGRDPPVPADDRLKEARLVVERHAVFRKVAAVAPVFAGELLSLLVVEGEVSVAVHDRADLAVADGEGTLRVVLRELDVLGLGLGQQRPVLALVDLRRIGDAHAQAVLAPGLDAHLFAPVLVVENAVLNVCDGHAEPPICVFRRPSRAGKGGERFLRCHCSRKPAFREGDSRGRQIPPPRPRWSRPAAPGSPGHPPSRSFRPRGR